MPAIGAFWKRTEPANAELPVNITTLVVQQEALRLPNLVARRLVEVNLISALTPKWGVTTMCTTITLLNCRVNSREKCWNLAANTDRLRSTRSSHSDG
jgi:hypothetical protein